jgi:hypothetical protein
MSFVCVVVVDHAYHRQILLFVAIITLMYPREWSAPLDIVRMPMAIVVLSILCGVLCCLVYTTLRVLITPKNWRQSDSILSDVHVEIWKKQSALITGTLRRAGIFIVKQNYFIFMSRLCTCVMDENHFQISLFGLIKRLLNSMVLSIYTTVCTGPQKFQT